MLRPIVDIIFVCKNHSCLRTRDMRQFSSIFATTHTILVERKSAVIDYLIQVHQLNVVNFEPLKQSEDKQIHW